MSGTGRIAVGVSGTGSNLRALVAAAGRGELGGEVVLVFADRLCAALDWAAEQGIETVLVPGGDDETLAETLQAVAPDVVVLAGYLRIVGPAVLAAFGGRIVNVHPSLLPAFPGLHAAADALAAGVAVTGVTVHLVDATLDGGPVIAQEAVPVLQDDTTDMLLARIHPVEHRLLPAAVRNLLAGALTTTPGARRARLDPAVVDAQAPVPRRALLSVSDKTGLVGLGRGLVARGWALVSTGGTARTLRDAGLPVVDVAAVTGFPEMLDGRVKTLHPRVHAGLLADRRRADHREALAAAGIEPFDLVVVNLYPFAAAARKPGLSFDDLVEEIDIGGPSMVRAAAKNHASVAIVTSPARYDAVLAALDEHGSIPLGLRSALAVEAYRHTAAYDARIAAELPARMAAAGVDLPRDPGFPGADDPYPPVLTVSMEKVETLRYGENPHQPAARYRRTDREARPQDGPFASGEPPLQGKALSYNNVLDASAAAGLARLMRGPAVVIVKHTNPCGAAERANLLDAWDAALAGDPVSAFGGVVAITGTVDEALADRLTSIFLEVVVAPAFNEAALARLATKPNLRLVADPSLGADGGAPTALDPLGSFRTAGGAVLVTAPDALDDDPAAWQVVTRRPPTHRERADLDLAWRLCRGVVSNAILLVRDGMLVGLGSGQVSRVDACRGAVEKARQFQGEVGARGAVAASDAFFPFPDGPRVLLDAGVTAIAQPGGSMRDAEVLADVDAAGGAMVYTGTRHFRH
ncbi:MAG TPA: bifunctional phosphoribosylaminoimidazolecarboxamide formyltransferase/IMP cyclohydrolase [Candidatus Limnocylindrales bacterium]|nr:bifunctional phosphoribosylaminoimidazolecarboxamide formyltransferase/IMP cyclohydrolase [Candidatus Limnocylindrales bacterium]